MLTPRLFTENLFDDLFDYDFSKQMNNLERKVYGKHANREMLTDVKESDDHYELEIDLPGFKKEDINVELNDGYLTISAQKAHENNDEDKKGNLIRQERYSGMMSRSFYVGEDITAEEIHGKYEGGVLTLNVPKKKVEQIENKNHIMIE